MFAGILVSLGAISVEWVQAFVSLKFSYLLSNYPSIDTIFQVIATVVFSGLAIYYGFFAPALIPKIEEKDDQKFEIIRGMTVSMANVMVFPYWIFYGTYLSSNGWLQMTTPYLLVFCSGVASGAFVTFVLFGLLGTLILKKMKGVVRLANIFLAILFASLSIYQLTRFF